MGNKVLIYIIVIGLWLITHTIVAPILINAESGGQEASTEYPIDNGSGSDQNITDVMTDWGDRNKPDGETMEYVSSYSQSTIGVVVSVIVWIFFALIAFTTACDLAYIVLPFTRTFLDNTSSNSQQGMMQQGMNLQGATPQGSGEKSVCLISKDLKSIMSNTYGNNQYQTMGNNIDAQRKNILIEYSKKRAVSIVLAVVILIIFVFSSVFTDMGFNIGGAILKFLGF